MSTPDPKTKPYPDVEPKPSFPAIEEKILKRWREESTFQESIDQRERGENGGNEYVFYDGPPFANGLPHYGHLLTGYVKDIVPRYQTMLGRRVERRFGWDCHGLPAEMASEKELGIAGRQAITDYGIEKFNAHCEKSVLKYTEDWENYVERQGRWVDFSSDYKTMDLTYMESVMWAFKQLWDKGLVYEGHRVMPYSWAAESPVSNFETRMDNSYRSRQDPALTVAFELVPVAGEDLPLRILVWTTTPWTLPSNLAICVGPEIDYAILEKDGARFLLAEAAIGKYEPELNGAIQVGTMKGHELVGRKYLPMFDYFVDHEVAENAFRIVPGAFVDTEEGTGVVHMAPGFGEDDQIVCQENGIGIVCPVDDRGRFTSEVKDFEGQLVFDANKPIIKRLKEEGKVIRQETYDHNYPHCWRTDEPLIYKALSSWYVKVTDFRDRMVELNQEINWMPEHIRDGQFGKWLEGARDWSISRNRFWGAPLPVWKSDDPEFPRIDVYGSLDELEKDFGVRPTNLHRPFIDELVRPNPDDPSGKSMMRRVPEVLDCWFESGSMPYAQVHYPFENKDWFENHFPSDFIVEYVAQTRGWFYTMMVLSTALFDRPPFKNCVCHGVVVDSEGKKLSKRLRNYPDPETVFAEIGADALRWFLVSSPILRGGDLAIDRDGKGIGDVVRLVINPIWNAYYFFTLYANSDGIKAKRRFDQTGQLDRYILSKTREMVLEVETAMNAYDIAESCTVLRRFLDALNNWYIRRSRSRFWSDEESSDKQDAYDTLYTVLTTLCQVAAPFLPHITEEVYCGLTGEKSVHLSDWPDVNEFPQDDELVGRMDRVRDICSTGLSIRSSVRIRTRLPLSRLVIAGEAAEGLTPFLDLITEEVNVKSVEVSGALESMGNFRLNVDARTIGPKLGKNMKDVLAATRSGNWEQMDDGRISAGGYILEIGEFDLKLEPKEGLEQFEIEALPSNDMLVCLDTTMTPELESEGLARDLVRHVQMMRRDADFHVSQKIKLQFALGDENKAAIGTWQNYIKDQVLATNIEFSDSPKGAWKSTQTLGSSEVTIAVELDS
ncbi:MAG: isoleucyl-tRNA synthetase [Planctomycetota bacterium]|jgi:isoleucyl-tRNA synthetase